MNYYLRSRAGLSDRGQHALPGSVKVVAEQGEPPMFQVWGPVCSLQLLFPASSLYFHSGLSRTALAPSSAGTCM